VGLPPGILTPCSNVAPLVSLHVQLPCTCSAWRSLQGEREGSEVQHASLYAALAHSHKTLNNDIGHLCCLPVVCLPGYEGIGCTPCKLGYFRAGEVSTSYTPPPFCIKCSGGLTTLNNASTSSAACTGKNCPHAWPGTPHFWSSALLLALLCGL
jgi:hypothetical protein